MKFSFSKFVWFDGKFIPLEKAKVPVTIHAIQYGTTIFEGIRGYWNSKNLYIFRLDDHIKRFRNSGKFYSISLNFTDSEIKQGIIDLCKKNKLKKSCYIRPHLVIYLTKMELQLVFLLGKNLAILLPLPKQKWVEII
jgi:branched-chain amino acid aminotransferase